MQQCNVLLTAWTNTRLSHAQQKSQNQDPGIIPRAYMRNQNNRPDQDHPAHVFGNRQTLDQQIRWNRPEQVAEVEDGCNPRVALPL